MIQLASIIDSFTGAFDFILHSRQAVGGGHVHVPVGGIPFVWTFARTQLEVSAVALGGALAVGMPIGLVLGHMGKGEYFAVGFGNAGRAGPEIAVVFLLAAIIGIGLGNVALALGILGLPPILTNTFVAIRQVDPTAVEAAEGMGMRPWEVIMRVELPLAAPTIMAGGPPAALKLFAPPTTPPLARLSPPGGPATGPNEHRPHW